MADVIVAVAADVGTVSDGALLIKGPAEVLTYQFDWDDNSLAAAVTISSSTWTITALRPTSDTALTKDQESVITGNRKTQVRISAGTLGALYRLENAIVTSESPAQTKKRSVRILVQTR